MTESQKKPPKQFAGLAAAIGAFIAGAALGCINGFAGDEGSSTRAIDWSIRTGFLLAGMMVFLIILAARLLPRADPRVGWGIIFGLGFVIMGGGGVALGMSDKDLTSEVLGGIIWGGAIGAAGGPFLHQVRSSKTSTSEDSRDKENAT